jgi:hypothetical protein
MEKQLKAEREKRAAILRAEGQAQAIKTVFQSIHDGDPDPKLLAYQYLQTLPQLAAGEGNTVWMIPSELTGALRMLTSAFGNTAEAQPASPAAPASPEPVGVPIPAPRPSQPARTAEVIGPPAAAMGGLPSAALPGQPPALGQRQVPGQRPTYVPEAPPTAPMPEYGQRSDADGQAGR